MISTLLWLAAQAMAAPPPDILSAEAKAGLAIDAARPQTARTMAERRAAAEAIQQDIGQRQMRRYGVTMTDGVVAGVPVRIFTPRTMRRGAPVLMNLHGGGFMVDSGSITENVPVAALTGYKVVAARYRLMPETTFPAALDDALAVYRDLVRTHPTRRIGVYGTSAGAVLTAQLAARLKHDRLPLPGALGIFSGSGDLSRPGDSVSLFLDPTALRDLAQAYAAKRELTDPALSPARTSLAGWPPTLCVASSRDYLLSATADLCRKLDEDGSPARFVMFDGLPHAFWSYIEAPESDAAFATMARFLKTALEREKR
ncbi:alpha/beta hydrolase [Sphingomonas sp. So64.6b]|uniref:alpha/beta hydrolase n=1 Tax=Sphingomonas sp. So64.6b TaxID=2997354 RepID=UPI0016038E6A|nr:alpha/beta hydrolase [Sphingomonas sp. So64.6b]QNA85387.1 alpha/beta hydrolase [Sphingomonas sp. So64.6b]